jgi:hypothetical protein
MFALPLDTFPPARTVVVGNNYQGDSMPKTQLPPSTRPLLFRWLDSLETDTRLTRPVRHLALAIAREMNIDGQHAFPSSARLAKRIGCDERTVTRNLAILKKFGWIEWYNYPTTGPRLSSNHYRALIPEGFTEVDTRMPSDKSVHEMSEYYTGEIYNETDEYPDILNVDTRMTYIDIAVVALRQHFCLPATVVDGHAKLRAEVEKVYAKHGIDGLQQMYDKVTADSAESLRSAESPCRVIAHRVAKVRARVSLGAKTFSFDDLIESIGHAQ